MLNVEYVLANHWNELDGLVFGGLFYSVGCNWFKYILTRNKVKDEIQEIHEECDLLHVSADENTPFGIYSRNLVSLIQTNNEKYYDRECYDNTIQFNTHYVNTKEELEKIFTKYELNIDTMPLIFPLRISESRYTNIQPLYYNKLFYDTSKKRLFRTTITHTRLPFTFIVFFASCYICGLSWFVKNEYPIFHPKRYITSLNIRYK